MTDKELKKYLNPEKTCDLIMKGGITSGIVYPSAVLELAQRYRLRNIGGTSAGAIAAAMTAAAEYGRESGGFEELERRNKWLCSGNHLFDFFQPSSSTRPLMEALLAANSIFARGRKGRHEGKTRRAVALRLRQLFRGLLQMWQVLWRCTPWVYGLGFAFGLVIGATIASFTLRGLWPDAQVLYPLIAIPALLCGCVTGSMTAIIGGVAYLLWILKRHVPQNLYGVCTGHELSYSHDKPRALTDWLHESVNYLAGLNPEGRPLTIGDLRQKGKETNQEKDLGIVLRTMTTDLSHAQPHVVPFEGELFLFHEDEMRMLFPADVVSHLVDCAAKSEQLSLVNLDKFHLLPEADNLPVVVVARLSLSFPLLLSAVPLYSIKRSAVASDLKDGKVVLKEEHLQRNWFSDGGISSNFPIHFFDVWLPTRPTFGINLTSLPQEGFQGSFGDAKSTRDRSRVNAECQTALFRKLEVGGNQPSLSVESAGEVELETQGADDPDSGRAVYLPRADVPQYPAWTNIKGIVEFLMAVWTTAQNYRDNAQSRLPSYRERVVQIRFSPAEGGLNLAMGEAEIQSITKKGREAGILLRDRFEFEAHRWVRFRVLMGQLEAQLTKARNSYPDCAAYEKLLRGSGMQRYPYAQEEPWCDEAMHRMEGLLKLLAEWEQRHVNWRATRPMWGKDLLFVRDTPRPSSILRVTPTV